MKNNKEQIIRDAIIESASVLFQKWGLKKTTMEDIAKAAGKGKSTVYYYYTNKEEIFLIVMKRLVEDVIKSSKEALNKEKKAEDKLRIYLLEYISQIKKYAALYDIARYEIKEGIDLKTKIRTKYDTEENELIEEIIRYGISNKEFRQYTEEEVKEISGTILGVARSMLFDLYIKNLPFNGENRMNVFLKVLFHGVKRQETNDVD
ncbi:TetR/AcrR family transcriptional regulator [Clostridium algoriphilum]|uniref:TetR/AcrR family transcriptional regulator n=1 Tax=Clostridium algoriphilum TaxID=198347 RepID=UPI001CF1E2B2|nr:TetR/AcrR family transcriptional regulator [Clostridium algoriphilum]MCB2295275.1 TetR/AcrR family transcriptional regulator [Clostridium algoriphilum]